MDRCLGRAALSRSRGEVGDGLRRQAAGGDVLGQPVSGVLCCQKAEKYAVWITQCRLPRGGNRRGETRSLSSAAGALRAGPCGRFVEPLSSALGAAIAALGFYYP